jgi:ATP-dependent DNA helicase RecG
MIPEKESLKIEFKSDKRKLSDNELIESVVAMVNSDGGEIFVGVENDGTPTGLHIDHENTSALAALIGNRTRPSVAVRVEMMESQGKKIAIIEVPTSQSIIATSDGKILRRRLKADGSPEDAPLYPYEIPQRLSGLRLIDPSAQALAEAVREDFDPVERERLRNSIRINNGEKNLLELSDNDLEGALGLVTNLTGDMRPTLVGMLLLGREESLRRLVPTHEAAFQVLEGTEIRTNEFIRWPLLKLIEMFLERFNARNTEQEIQDDLLRIPVPDFDRRAFREAIVNALAHRDYTIIGTTSVRFSDEGLTISNPGGFVHGVSPKNLLTVEPRPRNPILADVLKRIGLAERTGRGVDRIYEGTLRFGRPAPDYSGTSDSMVVLKLAKVAADVAFIRMITEEEKRTGRSLPVDALIVLSRLREGRRLNSATLAESTQRTEQQTRALLERLAEAGLIEAAGSGRGRNYLLSAKIYKKMGHEAEYVRQAGFDAIQQEQMVIKFVKTHGKIKRGDVMKLCKITGPQAYKLLNRLVNDKRLKQNGTRKSTTYTIL